MKILTLLRTVALLALIPLTAHSAASGYSQRLVDSAAISSGADNYLASPPINSSFIPPRVRQHSIPTVSLTATAPLAPAAVTPPLRRDAPGYVPDLRGMVLTPQSIDMRAISLDGSLTPLGAQLSAMLCGLGGGYECDGTYYCNIFYAYPSIKLIYAFAYSTEDWTMLTGWPKQLSQKFVCTDMSCDPIDKKVYGCFLNDEGNGYEFGTVNFAEGTRDCIATLSGAWNAVAFDREGKLFAIDMTGDLFTVDKASGAMNKVGATGFTPQNVSSATFDHKTNRMYWTISTDDAGYLCEVNTETGQAVKIADFPAAEEVFGLYVHPQPAEDGAPAAPTNLSASFSDGSLTGHLSFDIPATTFDGNMASGDVGYRVVADGVTLVSGTAAFGETGVTTPDFTVAAPGRYTFTLILSNSVGDSPKTELSIFVGADAPKGVTEAKATYNDGVFSVSWIAPTESANGGYIDPDQIYYTVTRLPDNVVVADGVSSTSLTDNVPIPASFVKYRYSIVASYQEWNSVAVQTNGIGLGNIVPPFLEEFNDPAFVDDYTVIDANGDGRSWGQFVNMARCMHPLDDSGVSAADDWLLTPAIKLEAGRFYKLEFVAASMGTTWPATFEVAVGNDNTAEAMTDIIIPSTTVATAGFYQTVPYQAYVSVPADGLYYIGIHYISALPCNFLLIDNLQISGSLEGMAPKAISDLVVTPDPSGAKKAAITFTAPTEDMSGNPLTSLSKIELSCDGDVVKTFESPSPGQALEFTHQVQKGGTHTFSVVAYNGYVAGMPTEVEALIGYNVPSAPQNISAAVTNDPGKVKIDWDRVTTDIDGKPMSENEVTYMVVRLQGHTQTRLVEGLTTNTYTHQALSDDDQNQEFFQYAVFAQNETGYSVGNVSLTIPVGTPYGTPYFESFADGGLTYIMAAMPLSGAGSWTTFTDQSFTSGVKSYDTDNGMLGMYGPSIGDAARIFTGKIDFAGLQHPTLTFYTFNLFNGTNPDLNELTIQADDGTGYTPVKTVVVNDACGGVRGWGKITVDLTPYAGKTVQIAFDAVTKSYLYTLIDYVEIFDRPDYDLAVIDFTSPTKVGIGQPFTLTAQIENKGQLQASDYTLKLLRNGEIASTIAGTPLESDGVASFDFTETLNATHEVADNLYRVEIDFSKDMSPVNNTSAERNVRLKIPSFPTVTNLSASESMGNAVRIIWNAPQLSEEPSAPVTEDFEGAETSETFPTEHGDWIFSDQDKGYIGGLQGVPLPGIQTGSQQSFWVMDSAHPCFGGNRSYHAHSGTKYLAQMYTVNSRGDAPVQCDDWIISPWLCEEAQTIEFYARSYTETEPERFQFLYSTTGTEIADFISVEVVPTVPNTWTLYSFDIPAGARYFAIRCTSIFEFMFFVDDITYRPANDLNLHLQGYNIYRDGIRLNESTLTEPSFVDSYDSDSHKRVTYSVSAVYAEGESTAVHTDHTLGVEDMNADNVAILSGIGYIEVRQSHANPIRVTSLDGRYITICNPSPIQRIPLSSGLYIVTVADKVEKTVVR